MFNSTDVLITSSLAAVVRDTVYLDGGILWWLPGLSDGSYATPISDSMSASLTHMVGALTYMPRRQSPGNNIHVELQQTLQYHAEHHGHHGTTL